MTEQRIKERTPLGLEKGVMLLCGGLLMLLMAYFSWTTVYSSDDYWYSTFWDHGLGRYLELMDYHYERFNGRVLVHVLAHIVLHFDRWAFALLCCGLCGAACFGMVRGAGLETERSLTAVCLFLTGMLCMPLQIFNQGVMWISASCNYFFPAALVCLMAAALERESKWCFLLAFLCGATTEQIGLASAALAAVYAVYGLLRRRGALRGLGCTVLAMAGVVTIFLSPATANRADTGVRMDSLEMILNTFRKTILREAKFLTENPAPVLVMLAILVLGAVILWREKGWKWAAVPAGFGCAMLLVGWLCADQLRIAGFVAAFLALALMAVLLMIAGRSFAGALTLTGLAAAAVMLPTNTVEPRVMLPVYFLLLIAVCVLAAETIRRGAAVAAVGLVLAVVVSIPAILGYWHNYQIDLENASYAREDRETGLIRYCVDYDMDYTWVKADFDPYFRMKYMESIGLPEQTPALFFSGADNPARIKCGDTILARQPWVAEDGAVMFPLREVTETLGGSLEWGAEQCFITVDGICLRLIHLEGSRFLVRTEAPEGGVTEFELRWEMHNGEAYCEAALFEKGFGLTVREEPESALYIVEK